MRSPGRVVPVSRVNIVAAADVHAAATAASPVTEPSAPPGHPLITPVCPQPNRLAGPPYSDAATDGLQVCRAPLEASVAFGIVAPHSARWRVLIAEDDPVVRQVLVDLMSDDELLDCAGVAGDAAEAVDIARREQPDVAVLDVKMPAGGGPRAARDIRAVSPATRIIAFSAFDDDGAKSEMKQAGAEAYLVKGVSIRALLSAIREACENLS